MKHRPDPEKTPAWEECKTALAWVLSALDEGHRAEVITLIKTLPAERQTAYHAILKSWVEESLRMGGRDPEVIALVSVMPEPWKPQYREIYKRIFAERKEKS